MAGSERQLVGMVSAGDLPWHRVPAAGHRCTPEDDAMTRVMYFTERREAPATGRFRVDEGPPQQGPVGTDGRRPVAAIVDAWSISPYHR
jgi:hypothetical protein